MTASKDAEVLREMQDKYFNMMRDHVNLIVWLQLNHPDTYMAYRKAIENDEAQD